MHPATAEQDFMLAQDFKDRAKQKPIIYPHPHIVRVRWRVLLPTAAARASLPGDSDAAPGMGAVAGTHTGPPKERRTFGVVRKGGAGTTFHWRRPSGSIREMTGNVFTFRSGNQLDSPDQTLQLK